MSDIILAFRRDIAEKFKSADVAVVYEHVLFWLRNNSKKGLNLIDGKTWMYETAKQMSDHFGYISEDVVTRCLTKLVDEGYLIRDFKNKNKFDRTSWYTLPDDSKKVFETAEVRNPKHNSTGCSIQEKHTEEQQLLCSLVGNGSSIAPASVSTSVPHEVEKSDFKGSTRLIRKNDIFFNACKTHKDWTTSEIEDAWVILVGYEKISDPIELMAGIIKKMRVKEYNENQINKINKEKSCQSAKDSNHQKKQSDSIKGISSKNVTLEQVSPNWRQELKLPQKS